jgi:hypothetical protein
MSTFLPADNPELQASESKQPARTEATPKDWLAKIQKRYKDLQKDWLNDARKATKLYEGGQPDTSFNILYSNTQTLLPALYNSTPRVEVSRRYTQTDEVQKKVDSAVSTVAERVCSYAADTNSGEYESYSEAAQDAVLNSLVPGFGNVRVRYHEEEGYQTICYDSVQYDRFVWMAARKWRSVTWIAFGHDLSKYDFEEAYPEFCKTPEYLRFSWDSLEKDVTGDGASDKPEKQDSDMKAVLVWELWDAETKVVKHLCSQWQEEVLLEEPYPEKLTSRFPCPRPLMYTRKLAKFCPIVPYKMYTAQAEELNRITNRMIRIVRALRVKGIYNSANTELQMMFNEDDENILVPSESSAAFQDGIDKAIWFMPIDMLVATLTELYTAQQNCKQTIYEIMGISDIQRGQSDPNETAKAQQIKNNWGGLRVKKHQRDVQDFCRDLFRITVEFGASYFSLATWQQITKAPLLTAQQKQEYAMAMQQYQMQVQQTQQSVPPPMEGQTQQPPPQPPPPPVSPGQMSMMNSPSWEEVIQILQDNFERSYRIDVETNSTIDLEATEDKEAVAEFMNAFGQMMSGLTPLIENGTMPFEAAKVFLMEVTKRFRFGRQVEAVLEQMKAPENREKEMQAREEAAALEVSKAQAQAAAQVEQMRKQLTEASGKIEQLQVQLQEQRTLNTLEKRSLEVDGKEKLHAVKSDYQGKVLLQAKDSAKKDVEMTQDRASTDIKELFNTMNAQLEKTKMAIEQQATEFEQDKAGEEKEASLLTQITASQETLAEAMATLIKLTSAPRKRRLEFDGKGKPIGMVDEVAA